MPKMIMNENGRAVRRVIDLVLHNQTPPSQDVEAALAYIRALNMITKANEAMEAAHWRCERIGLFQSQDGHE